MYATETYKETTSYNCYQSKNGKSYIHISLVDYLEMFDNLKLFETYIDDNIGQYYVPEPNPYASQFSTFVENHVFGKTKSKKMGGKGK